MKQLKSFALMTGIALTGITALTACSSSDLDEERVVYDDHGQAGVKSEFVISIPRKVVSVTRMSDYVTQSSGSASQFRGIDNLRLIPFASEPAAGSTKLADIIKLTPVANLDQAGSDNYKVYSEQFVPIGTSNFLFYGRAIANTEEEEVSSMDDKFKYGILNVSGLTDDTFTTPSNITFSLEQINISEAAQAGNATGQNIVQLLTDLAQTGADDATAPNHKWSTTNNLILGTLYKKFTGVTTSSSHTLSIILSKVYNACMQIPSTADAYKLATAIKSNVMKACLTVPQIDQPAELKDDYKDYPGRDLGLPDGAVRVRWNGSAFEDVSAHYGKGYELKITDYCYPAALWYYTSSPLKAADSEKSPQYSSASSWSDVIGNVYRGASDVVQAGTQSVALCNAAEYGVGRLETRIKMEEGTYYDANGVEVDVTKGFTMKGLLLGGQSSVGYDFTQKGSENRAIYDREIDNQIIAQPGKTTPANQTLALETEKGKTIYAVLELKNNGGDFMGADGVIPADGTFYLAVMLNPKADTEHYKENVLDKLIQQDYVTQLTITIKNGSQVVDRNGDGVPDKYVKDENGMPQGVDENGDGTVDPYDINGDGVDDTFIKEPEQGGPGWDINGDGKVDIPLLPDDDGNYPDSPSIPEGLGCATNGIPDITSPGVELGTSVDLEWKPGLVLTPEI